VDVRAQSGRVIAIPAPRDDDSEDVHWALSAATTLWDRGEEAEALKWLRRAAGAAADRDADQRAVELFKAAADVASVIEGRARRPREAAPQRGTDPTPLVRRAPKNLTPPIPPAARIAIAERFPELKLPEGGEEDTVIRPEEMLRRALMAIDPDYARRTDWTVEAPPTEVDDASELDSDDFESDDGVQRAASSGAPEDPGDPAASDEEETQATTRRRRHASVAAGAVPEGALPALRVAVLAVPEDGDVRLVFLPPGEQAPPGVVVALLVPTTAEDAEKLARLYAECHAKL
jgi:hypothetical protein